MNAEISSISHRNLARLFWASALIFAVLLFSSQLVQAQSEQQAKLVGAGAIGYSSQGSSVVLSADGNTAIIGGPGDNGNLGAAWVFTRRNGVWTQQSKLVGTGAIGHSSSLYPLGCMGMKF